MSGLARYLSIFREEEEDFDYNASLSLGHPEPQNLSISSAVASLSDDDDDCDDYITYAEWRKICNERLLNYIHDRFVAENLIAPASDEDDGQGKGQQMMRDCDDHDDDDDNTHMSSVLLADEPESQPQWHASGAKHATSAPKLHTVKVPLIQNTLYDATTISALDLYTKSLTLSLLNVETVFPLRHTKRLQKQIATIASFSQSDDGPLSTVYKRVLSVHLLQPHQSPNDVPLAQKRRIVVYFYNDYATAIHAFLQAHCTNHKTLTMSLANVPASCIFPFSNKTAESSRWVHHENDMSPYCIGVGGPSLCLITGQDACLSFDCEDLQVTLISVLRPNGRSRQTRTVQGILPFRCSTMHVTTTTTPTTDTPMAKPNPPSSETVPPPTQQCAQFLTGAPESNAPIRTTTATPTTLPEGVSRTTPSLSQSTPKRLAATAPPIGLDTKTPAKKRSRANQTVA